MSKKMELEKGKEEKKKKVLDEGCPVIQFYVCVGIWSSTPLRSSDAWKCFWKEKQRLVWEKCGSFISCPEVLVHVGYVDPGKPDTQSKARGTRNNLTEFWDSGFEFTVWRTASESDSLSEDQGAGQEAQVGIGFRIPRWQAGLVRHEQATSADVQSLLLRRMPCFKFNALWSPSWNF